MKRERLFFLSLMLTLAGTVFAQYESVVFNYEKSQFNDGGLLPAETYMLLSGAVSRQVTLVEVAFYGTQSDKYKSPKYHKQWKREFTNTTERFEIPINYKLKGNSEIDVYINYFRLATTDELKNVRDELFSSLDAYIDQNLVFNKKDINVLKSGAGMVDDLNSIARSAMIYYRSHTGYEFPGFSDLVLDKIKLISKSKQNRVLGKKATDAQNLSLKEKHIRELKLRVHSEVSHMFNSPLSVLADSKFIDDYMVEKTPNFFTFHGGYGSAYLAGDLENNTFGSSPVIGMSFPLGNDAFSSAFWSRSSLMAGVYLKNMDSQQGYEISGPIVNRPVYLGLGYKLFQFIRLSGGVVVLENNKGSNTPTNFRDNVYFRPYVSLSADLNLWIDFGR